jgi:hypothetical protein
MGNAGYVSVCVQALLCWFSLSQYMFRPTWPSLERAGRQTHARKQQNNEEKQHRKNKWKMCRV